VSLDSCFNLVDRQQAKSTNLNWKVIVFERESDPTMDYQIRILLFKSACESLRLPTSGPHGSEVTTSSAKTLGLLVVKKNVVFRTLKDHLSKQFRE